MSNKSIATIYEFRAPLAMEMTSFLEAATRLSGHLFHFRLLALVTLSVSTIVYVTAFSGHWHW